MAVALTPARAAVGGAAVLMACACGAADNTSKLLGVAGIGASTKIVHPILLGVGVGLVLYGLWRTAKGSGYLALAAFGVLAVAATLTPPTVMSTRAMPWNDLQMAGAGLYLVAAALLAYSFWRAFPSPKPAASGTAIGGATLATGCSCCMVTGAVAGMAVTAGGNTAHFQSMPLIFLTGLAVVVIGLFRLGGIRPLPWLLVGGLVAEFGPDLMQLTGEWLMAGVNMRFIVDYAVRIAGAGLILYGFAVAYEAARSSTGGTARAVFTREPMLGGAGDD